MRPQRNHPLTPEQSISIHAPAWGATFYHTPIARLMWISIHAPAWGATTSLQNVGKLIRISIHAPAWGATGYADAMKRLVSLFQSTHPHGVRHLLIILAFLCRDFNPRTRMGCDSWPPPCVIRSFISIHAPAWGATILNFANQFHRAISIHAPAWGATFDDVRSIVSAD